MWVELTRNVLVRGFAHEAGEVLWTEAGAALVRMNKARPASPPVPNVVEMAVVASPERAVAPRQRRRRGG